MHQRLARRRRCVAQASAYLPTRSIMAIVVLAANCDRNAARDPARAAAPARTRGGVPAEASTESTPGWLSEAQSTFRLFDLAPGASAIEHACPFVAKSLPPCPETLDALTKNAVRDRAAEPDGREIVVVGPLGEQSVCPTTGHPAAIGNRQCWALTVGASGTSDVFLSQPPWRWDGTTPTPFWCCGDASATCCGVTRHPTIAARGVYRSGDIPVLEQASVCAVQPGLHAGNPPTPAAQPGVEAPSPAVAWPPRVFDTRHWLGPVSGPARPFSLPRGSGGASQSLERGPRAMHPGSAEGCPKTVEQENKAARTGATDRASGCPKTVEGLRDAGARFVDAPCLGRCLRSLGPLRHASGVCAAYTPRGTARQSARSRTPEDGVARAHLGWPLRQAHPTARVRERRADAAVRG